MADAVPVNSKPREYRLAVTTAGAEPPAPCRYEIAAEGRGSSVCWRSAERYRTGGTAPLDGPAPPFRCTEPTFSLGGPSSREIGLIGRPPAASAPATLPGSAGGEPAAARWSPAPRVSAGAGSAHYLGRGIRNVPVCNSESKHR